MRPCGIPPRLLRAYRDTIYRADGIDACIGRRCPGKLLARLDTRTAVFLTAWNPWSRRMPAGWNNRMQQRLRQCLRRFRAIDADGSLRRWHEGMLLVAGDPRPMVRLAARFRQCAVVILRDGDRTRLRLLTVSTGIDGGGRRANMPSIERGSSTRPYGDKAAKYAKTDTRQVEGELPCRVDETQDYWASRNDDRS